MTKDRTTRQPILLRLLVLLAPAVFGAGCVQRTLQIDSNPQGALVYLNGEEAGRTPMRKNFVWYGTYDVQLRKEGYKTMSRKTRVWAPWWQVPPFDLVSEMLPLEDKHYARYRLKPVDERLTDPEQVLGRAVEMRGKLKSSRVRRRAHAPEPAERKAEGG